MTKTVKDYVERKIKEASMPKKMLLEKKLEDAKAASPDIMGVAKEICASKEYKAVEAYIRKWAKAHGAKIEHSYRGETLMVSNFTVYYTAVENAETELMDYVAKVNNVVEEAIVTMEMSKSKADLDAVIAEAVASL